MRVRRGAAAAALLAALGCRTAPIDVVEDPAEIFQPAAPEVEPAPGTRFDRTFERYLSLPNDKAFAVAGNPNAEWTGGIASGALTPYGAVRAALDGCRQRLPDGAGWSCSLYAVGSRRIDHDPELQRRYGADAPPPASE